jgi:hypothetical protein
MTKGTKLSNSDPEKGVVASSTYNEETNKDLSIHEGTIIWGCIIEWLDAEEFFLGFVAQHDLALMSINRVQRSISIGLDGINAENRPSNPLHSM